MVASITVAMQRSGVGSGGRVWRAAERITKLPRVAQCRASLAHFREAEDATALRSSREAAGYLRFFPALALGAVAGLALRWAN